MSQFISGSGNTGNYVVGIVGATGAVGIEVINCLHERKFPVKSLHLYASSRSSGKVIETLFGKIVVEEYSTEKASKCQFIFLAVSGDFALANAKLLTANNGPIVIDNSSAFRYFPEIPLVVRTTQTITNLFSHSF
jgi:aspartate-semialdehyde dehydrogenase